MFSFIRLIDTTMIVGNLVCETDHDITIENAVMLGRKFTRGGIEAQYFFTGMFNPFTTETPYQSILEKKNVISFHSELDSDLESTYNKFIEDWLEARNSFAEMTNQEVENMLEDTLEKIDAMNESANTTLH
jgi:hypothetical protein